MKHNYLGIWLLLAVAFLIVLFVAFTDDFSFGPWSPKKAPYREALVARAIRNEGIQQPIPVDSILEVPEEPVAVDSLPQSILLIGDSMTFNLALRLAQYAGWNGHTFHAVNWDSSNTKTWAGCDTLNNLISRYDVTQVFISLGSNEVYLKNPFVREPEVRSILGKIGDIPYVWIGPPNWKEDNGLNSFLATMCRKGSFFLTGEMELRRRKDGIHPTRDASVIWMDSIARWIPASSHPFILETPPDSCPRYPANITVLKALNK